MKHYYIRVYAPEIENNVFINVADLNDNLELKQTGENIKSLMLLWKSKFSRLSMVASKMLVFVLMEKSW